MDLFESTPTQMQLLMLVAARVGAMLLTMPVFGSRVVPALPKVALTFLVAFVILPTLPLPTAPPAGFDYVLTLARELLVGGLCGFAVNLVFTGVHMAGGLAAMQLGLGIENQSVTEQAPGSALEQFYAMFATVVFLTTNSHHAVLLNLRRLYETVPLGGFTPSEALTERFVTLSASVLMIAGRIALPIIGALLLTDIVMAFLSRIAPQMNVFFVGLPLKQAVGIFGVCATLPILATQAEQLFGGIARSIVTLFT